VQFIPLDLVDEARDRPVPADLFLPEIPNTGPGTVPIIVFSHGLGHSRIYFRDVAKHLASYGFAVAMPEHIGSNETQRNELNTWLADEFFQRREFINRPLDISFLLDELSRLNPSQFAGQLNTNSVGAIGHSFGAYTILANAGATVDFDWLQQHCVPDTKFIANLSRLLQCRALELQDSPEDMALLTQGQLKDERIKMVMAFNPVSNLFGQSGIANIQIPTLIAGGVFDFVTPLIPEQADTFSWLTTPDKYFLLVEQKAHGAESTRTLKQFLDSIEADLDIELAQAWLRSNYQALVTAFAQTYVAGRDEYRPYLEPAYVNTISQPPFSMHLVRD
jgi:predicted dienelactone hydrolase